MADKMTLDETIHFNKISEGGERTKEYWREFYRAEARREEEVALRMNENDQNRIFHEHWAETNHKIALMYEN